MAEVEVIVEETIAAAPVALYELVSDVTRMGEWSPETTSCRWLGGATGAAVGVRFSGANRDRWRRWSTTCTVVEADAGRRFAFDVSFGPFPVSRWAYDFVAQDGGCLVRETWTDRRQGWMVKLSPVAMGVRDRGEHNRDGMRATLSALRHASENATG